MQRDAEVRLGGSHKRSRRLISRRRRKGPFLGRFVGQQLRAAQTPLTEPQLFYWQRTGGRLGKIDYIIQHGNRVVPVEVKS
ncbi:MAG: DUF4143 domain-containing protein [Deltaproteobacteria bacterium]|nr:DUF4143 domain-containing protein [Deltaproteobacteria bacterium]